MKQVKLFWANGQPYTTPGITIPSLLCLSKLIEFEDYFFIQTKADEYTQAYPQKFVLKH